MSETTKARREPLVAMAEAAPLRKRRDLVQSYRDKIVGGVILEVAHRRLHSSAVTVEATVA